MAISVSFFNLAKAENSTKRPADNSAGLVASCLLKAPTDVMNPVIELRLASGATFPNYNYAYIPDFSRYYWITNWEWQAGFWLAYLKVDVLATYKTQLAAKTDWYILRQSLNHNVYIKDELYPITGQYEEYRVPRTNVWWEAISSYANTGCYVVSVIGNNTQPNIANGFSYYIMDPAGFRAFTGSILNPNLTEYDADSLIEAVGEAVGRTILKPMEYISSVVWYPFSIPSDLAVAANRVTALYVGFFPFSFSQGNIYFMPTAYQKEFYSTWVLRKHPETNTRGVYLNGAPYTDITLEVPRIKTIPINVDRIKDSYSLTVTLSIDMCSGEGVYIISAKEEEESNYSIPLDTYPVKIGVELALANDQIYIDEYASIISTQVAGVAAVAQGNAAGAIQSAGAAIGQTLDLFAPHVSVLGGTGSFLQLAGQLGLPVLYYRFHYTAPDDNAHHGKPLCMIMPLGSGFNQVMDGVIDLPGAYLSEIQQVRAYLEQGMYLE